MKTPYREVRKRRGSAGNENTLREGKSHADHSRPFVFKLGVCAMECKVKSSPMQSILKRLAKSPDFEIIEFPESLILNEPPSVWPGVDCLITFHSSGYPLDKVHEYVKTVDPVILNELQGMRHLRNRISILKLLKDNDIPTPSHIVVDHLLCSKGHPDHIFEEHYDYIVYNGLRLNKPFIEKPSDSDNHNNYVYYPRNTGGGCKKLFRKIQDRSSIFDPDYHQVRRDGTYVYEEFLSTFGMDVKVYTVGPFFAHAEARKAPTLDGKVQRTAQGKEVRYPVILTENEKVMAYKIVATFKQVICGFDILRTTNGLPYVGDVNGWSFVKGNVKYYNDCAHVMRIFFLNKLQKKYNFIPRELREGELSLEAEEDTLRKTFIEVDDSVIHPNDADEELRAMVVVMRHGDRQPKQKLKFETSQPEILQYHEVAECIPWGTPKQIKLKSPEELQTLLEKAQTVIQRLSGTCRDDTATRNEYEHFCLLQSVLQRGDGFAGINRKFQIKPVKWTVITKSNGEQMFAVTQQLIVAKWGGELTRVGCAQAEDLGKRLRAAMYPGDGEGGLLRLHSTFRHDLKIYTSDEGRCQVTSAAFTKGFLDLEGQLTPILVQMVVRNAKAHTLLDASPIRDSDRHLCKIWLDQLFNSEHGVQDLSHEIREYILHATGYAQAAHLLRHPKQTMIAIQNLIQKLVDSLSFEIQQCEEATEPQTRLLMSLHKHIAPERNLEIQDRYSVDDSGVLKHPFLPQTLSRRMLDTSLDDLHTSVNHDCLSETPFCNSCRLILLLSERLQTIRHRWQELKKSWYREKDDRFDSSKIPDLVDHIRYDLIHNHTYIGTAALQAAFSIYTYVEPLTHFVGPAEYGLSPQQKINIGMTLIPKLLRKIIADITFSRSTSDKRTAAESKGIKCDASGNLSSGNTTKNKQRYGGSLLEDSLLVTPNAAQPHVALSPSASVAEGHTLDSLTKDGATLKVTHLETPLHNINASQKSSEVAEQAQPPPSEAVIINTGLLWGHQEPRNTTAQGGFGMSSSPGDQSKGCLMDYKAMVPGTTTTITSQQHCVQSNQLNNSTEALHHEGKNASLKSFSDSVTELAVDLDNKTNVEDEDHDDTQNHFRLKEKEAKEMGIKSPWRIVRSRYYVASASHIFSLLNILLYGHRVLHPESENNSSNRVDEDIVEAISNITDMHYLSHIVFRVWEKRVCDSHDPNRFRVEIQFSTGAKDGFGSNYVMLREHAQVKQAVFQKHVEHLLTHHSKTALSIYPDVDGESSSRIDSHPAIQSSDRGALPLQQHATDTSNQSRYPLTPVQKLQQYHGPESTPEPYQCDHGFLKNENSMSDELPTTQEGPTPHSCKCVDSFSVFTSSDYTSRSKTRSLDYINSIEGSRDSPRSLTNVKESTEAYSFREKSKIPSPCHTPQDSVPPYCEINPLHRLTRNWSVGSFEKMIFLLLNQGKTSRLNQHPDT